MSPLESLPMGQNKYVHSRSTSLKTTQLIEKYCTTLVPMPPFERLLMGQSWGKLGSFLTPVTPIYFPVHPKNSAG